MVRSNQWEQILLFSYQDHKVLTKRKVVFFVFGCFVGVLLSLQDYLASTCTTDMLKGYTYSDGSILSETVWYSSSILILNEIFRFEKIHFYDFHGCFHELHEHSS